jgi:hypothetical protein
MTKKFLRREILIREYDFIRMNRQAQQLYDRISFEPITSDWIQKQITWASLKGDKRTVQDYAVWQYPSSMLNRMENRLYDKSYLNWLVKYDDEGYLTIRSRINAPISRLGWATFEKDPDEPGK